MNSSNDKNCSTSKSDCSTKNKAEMNAGTKSAIDADRNADPITGAAGAHPVGTSIGAIGVGAAAGAAGGLIAGPVGAVVGAVAGAVAGGYAGKAAAEAIDPTVESRYWSDRYSKTTYADPKVGYDQFAPAYRYGWESYDTRGRNGETFESVEADLNRGWNNARHDSKLAWETARPAARDAWDRLQNGRSSNAGAGNNSIADRNRNDRDTIAGNKTNAGSTHRA